MCISVFNVSISVFMCVHVCNIVFMCITVCYSVLMCVTVLAPVPLDPPQRASGLRTNGSEATPADRSVAGQERNQLLHRERGPQPEHGEEEEEGGGAGRAGRKRGGGGRSRESR